MSLTTSTTTSTTTPATTSATTSATISATLPLAISTSFSCIDCDKDMHIGKIPNDHVFCRKCLEISCFPIDRQDVLNKVKKIFSHDHSRIDDICKNYCTSCINIYYLICKKCKKYSNNELYLNNCTRCKKIFCIKCKKSNKIFLDDDNMCWDCDTYEFRYTKFKNDCIRIYLSSNVAYNYILYFMS